jgi:hypothetical protein
MSGLSFWDAFKTSVILSAVITMMLVGTICYMAIVGAAIPDFMVQWGGIIVTSYFVGGVAVKITQAGKTS